MYVIMFLFLCFKHKTAFEIRISYCSSDVFSSDRIGLTQRSDPSPPGPPVPHCYRHPGREAYIRCQRCDRTICPDCMVPASVGFQCPSCVHEGAKQTKQHKTAYGGTRSANPALTSWVLIGINVAVWLLITATGGAKSDWVLRL